MTFTRRRLKPWKGNATSHRAHGDLSFTHRRGKVPEEEKNWLQGTKRELLRGGKLTANRSGGGSGT